MILAKVQNCQIKKVKLPHRVAEEIPWNKISVYIIGPYSICING